MKIEKIVPGGQGLGTDADGRKIFLWNALPGEEVEEFEITKKKSKYSEGIATKISEKSEHRVEPKDACFLSTSPWQIFDYEYELKMKSEMIREVFHQNGIEIEAPEVFTDGNEWNYRNKMEYALYWDVAEEKIKLAFHRRGSHRKVPISQSSIERPEIFDTAEKIVAELNERHEEARKYQSLLLRTSQDGKVSGGLYENGKAHPVFPSLSDEICGISYNYSPNGFFQINLPVYEMALRAISEEIGENEKVLDLYSGVGTIGLSVARDHDLTLVECNKDAFREMKRNCEVLAGKLSERSFDSLLLAQDDEEGGLIQDDEESGSAQNDKAHNLAQNCGIDVFARDDGNEIPYDCGGKKLMPILAKSEDVLDYIEPEMTVILDPPRAGCEKKLLDRILEVLPPKVVYLSCNPATQARDAAILSDEYKIASVKAFNFFPKTPHIENLIVFCKK